MRARTAIAGQQALLDQAADLLRRTSGITLRDGSTITIEDGRVADRINRNDDSIIAAIDSVDLLIAAADRADQPRIDAAAADRHLGETLRDLPAVSGPPAILDAITRAVLRFLAALQGPTIDFGYIFPLLGLIGAAVIAFIVATLGRGLPERVRREVVLRDPGVSERADPAVRLRAADDALAAGRAREAIHALYLFAIESLAARELVRYDPALTDRELIIRAAAIPHADAFRDLVAAYERSWFGLREPTRDEAVRARGLATRVAG